MALERFANNSSTTLNGGIDDDDSPIVVTDDTSFPQSGQFRILIGSEIMLVTAGAGTTSWTVTRGAEGTVAASHSNGATVQHILTAGALGQFRADNLIYDTLSNRPAAADAGRLFIPSDGFTLQRDSGSIQVPFGPIWKMTPPDLQSWSWVNQGTATIATRAGAEVLTGQGDLTFQWRARFKAAPTPPYTIVAAVQGAVHPGTGFSHIAVGWRQSSDGKLVFFRYGHGGGGAVLDYNVTRWNSPTSFNANETLFAGAFSLCTGVVWIKIQDDNTNRIVSVSNNSFDWLVLQTTARTTFLTADQVGFGVITSTGVGPVMTLLSWDES